MSSARDAIKEIQLLAATEVVSRMLTEKAGFVEYEITDPNSGRSWTVDPSLVLADWQVAHAATRPDMIHATALLLADHYRQRGMADVSVRADAWVSMNGAPAACLVDPSVDLAARRRGELADGVVLDRPAADGP